MPELSDMFAELAGKLKEHEGTPTRPVNTTFTCEEDSLHFLSRVAQLQPGTIVTWREEKDGEEYVRRGVLIKVAETGRPQVFRFEEGHIVSSSLTPLCLVFEE